MKRRAMVARLTGRMELAHATAAWRDALSMANSMAMEHLVRGRSMQPVCRRCARRDRDGACQCSVVAPCACRSPNLDDVARDASEPHSYARYKAKRVHCKDVDAC